MELEVRDTQSGEMRSIPATGVTMGRQGSSAEFIVPDRTVSSRHARVFLEDGKWILEDLRSSNGTFVNGERLTAPRQLTAGDRFALCRYTFEVVRFIGAGADTATGMLEAAQFGEQPAGAAEARLSDPFALTDENPPSKQRKPASPAHASMPPLPSGQGAKPGASIVGAGMSRERSAEASMPNGLFGDASVPNQRSPGMAFPEEPSGGASRSGGSSDRRPGPGAARRAAPEPSRSAPARSPPVAQGSGVARVMAVVPGAFAYYVAAAPALLFNPIGFVRRGVAAPQFGALAVPELIGWALPANLISAGLAIIATLIYQLIWGAMTFGVFVSPLVTLAVYVGVAAVTGWIWHPLLRWFVRLLRGDSDEVSRSNMFVMVEIGLVLNGLAGAIAVFISIIPVPFIGMLPLLITLATSLILTWIGFIWYRHFNVVKWFPILLLVLGGLACLTTAKGLVDVIRADVARLGGSGDSADGAPVDVAAVTERLSQLQAEIGAAAARGDNEQVKAMAEELAALQANLAEASSVRPIDVPSGNPVGAPAEPAPAPVAGPKPATPPISDTPRVESPVKPANGAVAAVPSAVPTGLTRYEEFILRRDAVEKALERDPTLLKSKGLESAYRELHKQTLKVKQKYKVKASKKTTPEKQAEQKVTDMKRDAEIYEQTSTLVDQLYEKITTP